MSSTMIAQALGRLAGKSVTTGEIVTIEPDRVMSHDNTAFIIKKFRDIGRVAPWNKEKIVIAFDHCVPAERPEHRQNHEEARAFVREHQLPHFFDAGVGVCHQVMMERGFVLPGQVILGADSHSTLYGAMNAVGIPINRTEMAGIWATGEIWLRVPPAIRVNLTGSLSRGVYAKDLVLRLLRDLTADGATYRCLEYDGPGVAGLSMSERMTLTNMAVELGAKASIMPFDATTAAYLEGRAKADYAPLEPGPEGSHESTVTMDLGELAPQVSCPHQVDNVRDLGEVEGTRIHQGYLGSCTNGRLDDLRIAADILDGQRLASGVRLVVFPASSEVHRAATEEGIIGRLETAGAEIMTASCGPCFGAVGATLGVGEVCISSSNRNFCGRMGSPESEVYLASPAVVAASCVRGAIADPREFLS